jgi:hypothetical protein
MLTTGELFLVFIFSGFYFYEITERAGAKVIIKQTAGVVLVKRFNDYPQSYFIGVFVHTLIILVPKP